MAFNLSGKVALVTAGSAGLGCAIVRTLASVGMRVVINYSSNTERANALVAELENSMPTSSVWDGGKESVRKRFVAIQADVSQRPDIIRLVDQAASTMGGLDVVVSNTGWTEFRDFLDLDQGSIEEDWDRCFNVNVKAHLFLMHAVKQHLEASEGAFISTASLAGVKPSGSSLAYAVTKAAQIHLIKSLALITSPKIRVNSVSPGILLTEWGKRFSDEQLNAARERTQLKRLATVEDVALQVLCFAANKSITGTNAVIDAGLSV